MALEEELEAELGRGVNMADLLSVQSDADATSTVGDLIRVLAQRLA